MSNQPSVDPTAIPQDVALLLPRFLGRLIDGLLLMIPSLGLGLAAWFMGLPTILISVFVAAVCYGYFVVCDSQFGATAGKMVMGLKVIGNNGQNPTIQQACIRESFYLLQIIPFGIGGVLAFVAAIYIAITINNSPTGQGVHDTFADTRVVKK